MHFHVHSYQNSEEIIQLEFAQRWFAFRTLVFSMVHLKNAKIRSFSILSK